jgi:SAM-dependent methyltransferase
VGEGIDIGGMPDPLSLYSELFPLIHKVRIWDLNDGDALKMDSLGDSTFDFVHSSHCLEHLTDPFEGLKNWFRILKPGGHMIVTVPEEDLYEQGIFPSTFNLDHKWTFTINKFKSWSEKSINIIELLSSLGEAAEIKSINVQDATYRYKLPRYDQTSTPISESSIELIVRKRFKNEILDLGRLPKSNQPDENLRVYYNQYIIDYKNMKKHNGGDAPFSDGSVL